MNIPIVRITLEHMKAEIVQAMSDYFDRSKHDVQKAVEAVCTEEHVAQLLSQSIEKELRIAIQEEVHKFFTYGEGREAVLETVRSRLSEELKEREPA